MLYLLVQAQNTGIVNSDKLRRLRAKEMRVIVQATELSVAESLQCYRLQLTVMNHDSEVRTNQNNGSLSQLLIVATS